MSKLSATEEAKKQRLLRYAVLVGALTLVALIYILRFVVFATPVVYYS